LFSSFTTIVLGAEAPVFEVLLVMEEIASGLVVVQEKFMLQLLCPKAMAQVETAGVRVPDIALPKLATIFFTSSIPTDMAQSRLLGTPTESQPDQLEKSTPLPLGGARRTADMPVALVKE
jgi:hypothetical protein